ncbi:hypothetical protein PENDEC_c008G05324 [Penicillium decumbens]|uniref:Uncharacterized protein n=1 Tax=Penicillium decumbens TaxID=69771 RepID=A0A1V6PDY1_PENDC|nr:hypothetical protein PENDEC_c008G05324 [Penicillium decumbens]
MSISRHSPCPQTDFGRGPNWLHESPFLPLLWEQTQDLGAPSLKHAAMKKALMDQSALKPELFAQIPWHVAHYLWECLGRCDKQTLYMWKIMAETYPHQFRSVSEYYFLSVTLPKEPLKCYIDLMSSDTGSWRAILSMPTAHATPADLVAIGNLKNLVALDLYPASTRSSVPKDFDEGKGQGLEDRIVRSWLEMAMASGSVNVGKATELMPYYGIGL